MQEVIYRLNDYFFYQLVYGGTDSNPYTDFIARLREEVDPFAVKSGQTDKNPSESSDSSSEGSGGSSSDRSKSSGGSRSRGSKSGKPVIQVEDEDQAPDEDEYYSSSDRSKRSSE
jgi:hypothetical protein